MPRRGSELVGVSLWGAMNDDEKNANLAIYAPLGREIDVRKLGTGITSGARGNGRVSLDNGNTLFPLPKPVKKEKKAKPVKKEKKVMRLECTPSMGQKVPGVNAPEIEEPIDYNKVKWVELVDREGKNIIVPAIGRRKGCKNLKTRERERKQAELQDDLFPF